MEFFGGSDDGAGAGDGAEFGEEGGVHVRLRERILRLGKDGELGAMGQTGTKYFGRNLANRRPFAKYALAFCRDFSAHFRLQRWHHSGYAN